MKKKILCLVLTLALTAGMATTAFARDYQRALTDGMSHSMAAR